MLRVRFHGRGGHGVKTASRILGTAAFRGGLQVQDFPIYGAERRGAAVAAFTRIDPAPIRERGVIARPDFLLVGDETLLDDPAAGVLAGQDAASAALVNSQHDGASLARRYGFSCPVVALDLTALAVQALGRASALSVPLGAAACALTGVADADLTERAVREELSSLGVAAPAIDRNVELARRIHAAVPPVPLRDRPPPGPAGDLHAPAYVPGPGGVPIILAAGNSGARHTGAWRFVRPVIDRAACTRCRICLLRCPDGALTLDAGGYPVIDYDNCKGCMICARECPIRCIHEEKEVRAW